LQSLQSLKAILQSQTLMKWVFLILLLVPFNNIFAEEPVFLEQITSDNLIKVQLFWPEVLPDELYDIKIKFLDPQTNSPIEGMLVTYDIFLEQDGHPIEDYKNLKTSTGEDEFVVLFPEHSEGPSKITVTINSVLEEGKLVKINESLIFEVKVVPEFEALAMVVLALSFVLLLFLARGKLKIKQ